MGRNLQLTEIPATICADFRGVFCDIDDTLTTDGRLPHVAYRALWDGYRAGLRIVPVTGRPAGWVDHMARMWPVTAVVGENGAFYFWMAQGKMNRRFIQSYDQRTRARQKLEQIKRRILQEIPGAAVSADQNYRESDLAIDFCEDVARLDQKKHSPNRKNF